MKKFISLILSLALMVCLMPATIVYAEQAPEATRTYENCYASYASYCASYSFITKYYNSYSNGGEGTEASPWKIGKNNPDDMHAWIKDDVLHISGIGDMMDAISIVQDDALVYDYTWLEIFMASYDNIIDSMQAEYVYNNYSIESTIECNLYYSLPWAHVNSSTYEFEYNFNAVVFDSDAIASIPDFAFYNSNATIDASTMPTKIKYIGDYSFCKTDLTGTLNVPDAIETIGERAFEYTSVSGILVFPSTLKELGKAAFKNLNITKVTFEGDLPKSILDDEPNKLYCYYEDGSNLIEFPFYHCPLLSKAANTTSEAKQIYYLGASGNDYAYACYVDALDDSNYEINNIDSNCVAICNFFLEESRKIKSLTLPNTITRIGFAAICCANTMTYGFKDLNLEYIPANLFGNYGFDIDGFPSGVSAIGDWAFHNAGDMDFGNGTKTLTIPNTVKYIGDNAFSGYSFTKIVIPESVEYIGYSAFAGDSSTPDIEVTMPIGVNHVDPEVFGLANYSYNSTKKKYALDTYETKIIKLNYTSGGKVVLSIEPGLPTLLSQNSYGLYWCMHMKNWTGTMASTDTVLSGVQYKVYDENGTVVDTVTPTSNVVLANTPSGAGIVTKDAQGNDTITLFNSSITLYSSNSANIQIEYDSDFLTSVGADSSADIVFTATKTTAYDSLIYGDSKVAYNLTLTVKGSPVTDFNSDSLKVSIPYSGSLLDRDDYGVVYINGEDVSTMSSICANGCFKFDTGHFSVFGLSTPKPATSTPAQDGPGDTGGDNKYTNITYSVESGYEWSVPSSVELTTLSINSMGSVAITKFCFESGTELKITLSSDFTLDDGATHELAYEVSNSETEWKAIKTGATLLDVSSEATDNVYSVDLFAKITGTAKFAGTYEDTITFTAATFTPVP